ncbi:HlyD family efflux transporter periplasmic adaptor subunit [Nostoc sp.]|uniref:HlyD family efflux transporter periplasmic adaptor subunit n=1 Tax=Nostoc sp. TaxID=1180 RepID=UPI002FFCB394
MTQLNGNHLNGNQKNGVKQDSQVLTKQQTKEQKAARQSLTNSNTQEFEQSIVLRQSPIWSRTIMVTLILLACFGIGWAYFAKIEQVVPATGQLKPQGTVKEIQAPVSGVVKTVNVKDGQEVKPGDLLVTFDSIASVAELNSLKNIRFALIKENQIYRRLMGASTTTGSELSYLGGNLPPETAFLLKSRSALVRENELLRTQLKNSGQDTAVGIDEQKLLEVAKKELDSRSLAARLEVEKTKKQLSQNQFKLEDSKASLAIQRGILNKLRTLAQEGGISQLQYLNQQQEVQNRTAEVAQLGEETKRLQFDIEKGRQELSNTVALSDKTILDKIADNKQRIAAIDSQFMKVVLDNEQRLADVNSKISQSQLNIKYEELRAPVGGTVFDLQAKNPGFVATPTTKLLQIVPNENYIAEVFITNKDIGFVRKDMKVDVRIDSFPYSEFGDIKGKVIDIGSDALPPDQTHQFYRFPARVSLDKQSLLIKGKKVNLQSGMSISANIKVREERSVLSLFTELFTKQVDTLKEVR